MVVKNLKFGEEVEQVVSDTRWVSSMYRLKKFHFVSRGLVLIYWKHYWQNIFFSIHDISDSAPYFSTSYKYLPKHIFILLDAEFLIESMLLGTCFSNKEPLFPYAILAIDLKICMRVPLFLNVLFIDHYRSTP